MGRSRAGGPQGSFEFGDGTPSMPAVREAYVFRVMRDRRLLPGCAVDVAFAMAARANKPDELVYPRQAVLAEQTGLSVKQVARVLAALRDRGHLIDAGRHGSQKRIVMWRLARPDEPLHTPAEPSEAPTADDDRAESTTNRRARECGENPVQSSPVSPVQSSPTSPDQSSPVSPNRAYTGVRIKNLTLNLTPEPHPPTPGDGIEPRPEAADGISDRVAFAEPATIATERQRRAQLDAAWRLALITEPVVIQPDTEPLHACLADGLITEADVMAGIEAALALQDFRPRHWRSLVGFARKAAERRMASTPRPAPTTAGAPPAADLWELEGGHRRTMAFLEAEVAAWDRGQSWHEATLGFPPDSEFTSLPRHLWRESRGVPRLDKRAG